MSQPLAPALCKVCDLPYSEMQCDFDIIGRDLYFHFPSMTVCTNEIGREAFSVVITPSGFVAGALNPKDQSP